MTKPEVPLEEHDARSAHLLPSGTRVAPQAQVVLGPGATLSLPCIHQEMALVIEPADVEFEEKSLRKQIAATARGGGAARYLLDRRVW